MTTTTKILAAAFLLAATATLAGASDRLGWSGRGEEDEEHEHEGRDGRESRRAGVEGATRGASRQAASSAHDAGAAALYRKECGACHLAFPPGFLPADVHRRTLAGLDRHFGQNAEVDDATRARLEQYLVANAGRGGDAGTLRITELASFQRKHREVRRDVWTRASVRTPANCAACHRGAADWDFDEDRVKIPR